MSNQTPLSTHEDASDRGFETTSAVSADRDHARPVSGRVFVREVFAYYLPQYHRVPENDLWWGDGFTEWTHVRAARPLSPRQVIMQPGELGYYDLDDLTVLERQYRLAREHSISTFCFWHYWFNDDELLLEKPAERLLASDLDVRFCFAWANHSWWNKAVWRLLKDQRYDYSLDRHFDYLLPFFRDERYTKIDGRPVFFVFRPSEAENFVEMRSVFDERARSAGFPGLFWVGDNTAPEHAASLGLDRTTDTGRVLRNRSFGEWVMSKYFRTRRKLGRPVARAFRYGERVLRMNADVDPGGLEIPVVLPGWDSTPRHAERGYYLFGRDPENFARHVDHCCDLLRTRKANERLLVIKSWNEWAEGNTMEPDEVFGRRFLEVFGERVEIQPDAPL